MNGCRAWDWGWKLRLCPVLTLVYHPFRCSVHQLIKNNRVWDQATRDKNPDLFTHLIHQQSPEYLWIGCSDNRVPANEIVGLLPDEIFVYRNVANVVSQSDLNCLSVLQYAFGVLPVKPVIVTGHYDCWWCYRRPGGQTARTDRQLAPEHPGRGP